MIRRFLTILSWWRDRHLRRAKAEIAAHTFASDRRVSTKLTPAYTKRETRRLAHCKDLFDRGLAGTRKGLG